jgi:queuine tRNA-ribosyltransferase
VRHLFNTKELLAQRLLTLHNLTYTADLMAAIRASITAGSFRATRAAIVSARAPQPA